MKNVTTDEDIFSLLFFTIARLQKIPRDIQQEFMEVAEVVRAKEHEIIHTADQLSTHDYFIVTGIMMCYVEQGDDKVVKWLRSNGDYAYSRDMSKSMLDGVKFTEAGNILAAVDDVTVVKIPHADFERLMEKSPELSKLVSNHLLHNNQVFLGRRVFDSMDAEQRYEFMRDKVTFDLFRVPDVYLSSHLDITLKAMAKLRKKKER